MTGDADDARQHALAMLNALALTPQHDVELADTPARFTVLLRELFWGMHEPPPVLSTFDAPPQEPVILAALPFQSMCVHHLLPFFGTIDVAYAPGAQVVGFGSISRVIDYFAARPQMQERLVAQIADYLQQELKPRGLLVRCRARQMCMELRGARKRGVLISSVARGTLTHGPAREEILRQLLTHEETL